MNSCELNISLHHIYLLLPMPVSIKSNGRKNLNFLICLSSVLRIISKGIVHLRRIYGQNLGEV